MFAEYRRDALKLLIVKQVTGFSRRTNQFLQVAAALVIGGLGLQMPANANEIAFSEGHWVGSNLNNVERPGCMMAMQLDDDTALAIFATAAGDFDLAFSSKSWNINEVDGDVKAYLQLDGEPVTFTRVFIPMPSTIIITGNTPEDRQKLEKLIRKAEEMQVEFIRLNYSAHTSFFDNHLAVTALKNCVRAAEREAEGAQK